MTDLVRVNATLQKLLRHRGYEVPIGGVPTTDHFMVYRPGGDVLLVYRADDPRVGVVVIRDMVKLMDEHNIVDALLLAPAVTSSAMATIASLRESDKFIVTIAPASLMYDIFDHACVPPHRLMSKDEVDALLLDRNLSLNQFPSIKMDDAMCRYLGGKPGDVFEIMRNRPNVGIHVYYRKVVVDPSNTE